ncbi:hypothetical protein P152DRAFT_142887 [Eremomyces bilateralis CBS 781.70]|uniref:Septin-type G domain-containing protein n=1 Tax=Eremomyces bilateralis CBS 781.70 TaxID=1392243 RepID=A0A6G1FW47_9PEZI|nr:uncharacterized protein P152DRAFT_142887 [Eremomyces bilateralis CBS 781.70]KAF1809901.1 hypothetical protein P152DRAFT_142887 [Eremomyces bilateralis CBS 781.70]
MSNPSTNLNPSTDIASAKSNGSDGTRRTSFGFLRRQKSTEHSTGNRIASGGKMTKKQRAQAEELRKQQALSQSPPRLPSHSPLPRMNILGGAAAEDPTARPDSYALVSNKASGYPGQDFYHQQRGVRPSVEYQQYGSSPHGVPIPPIPGSSPSSRNGEPVDPYARTESMTHRGRYSYASSAVSTLNSPRRVRRRKDPTPFNILVVGAKNSGKTSFINFLKNSLQLPARKQRQHTPSPPNTALPPDSPFSSIYLESEIDHERIGVTLWDSRGLEKNIVDLQLREMDAFLESKFEETFTEEQKVIRAPGVRDTHIHCVFLILDPVRLDANITTSKQNGDSLVAKFSTGARLIGGLDEDLDIQVLRGLQGKTTVIPVISKADTITTAHMAMLKKMVWDSLKQAKLDPLEYLNVADSDGEDALDERDEDEYLHSDTEPSQPSSRVLNQIADGSSSEDDEAAEESEDVSSPVRESSPATTTPPPKAGKEGTHRRTPSAMSMAAANAKADDVPYLPLSIISPDSNNPSVIGRAFPWGFADPYNPEHCDFVRLKENVFSEWRGELREASREIWYEGWRTSRLKRRGTSAGPPSKSPAQKSGIAGIADRSAGYDTGSTRSRTNGSPETQRYRGH